MNMRMMLDDVFDEIKDDKELMAWVEKFISFLGEVLREGLILPDNTTVDERSALVLQYIRSSEQVWEMGKSYELKFPNNWGYNIPDTLSGFIDGVSINYSKNEDTHWIEITSDWSNDMIVIDTDRTWNLLSVA